MMSEWKLAPLVASLEMQNAGWREADRQGLDIEHVEMQPIYQAMLTEAPQPSALDGEPEVLAYRVHNGQFGQSFTTSKDPVEYRADGYAVQELIDSAHLEPLTAEKTILEFRLEGARQACDLLRAERDTLKAELAKAMELLENAPWVNWVSWSRDTRALLARQYAPAAKDGAQ